MTKEFGEVLQNHLERRGLTYTRAAELGDVSTGLISHYVRGTRSPRAQVTERLVDALNVPPEGLAEFLLYAAGYQEGIVEKVLTPVSKTFEGARQVEQQVEDLQLSWREQIQFLLFAAGYSPETIARLLKPLAGKEIEVTLGEDEENLMLKIRRKDSRR